MKPIFFITQTTTKKRMHLSLIFSMLYSCILLCIFIGGILILIGQITQLMQLYKTKKIQRSRTYASSNSTPPLQKDLETLHEHHQKLSRQRTHDLLLKNYLRMYTLLPSTCVLEQAKVTNQEMLITVKTSSKSDGMHYVTLLEREDNFPAVVMTSLEQENNTATYRATIKISM